MAEEEPVVAPAVEEEEAAVAAETPAPAAEEAAEAKEEEKKEEKPKEDASNGKTFEERLAELVKPESVPNPDQDVVNNKLSSLNAQIEKCDKRLTEIKTQIEKANASKEGGRGESKGIVEQLKGVRVRIKAASQEREEAFQQLRDMTQTRQAHQKTLSDLRRSLKFEDVESVVAKVKELESMIETGQCANLKEEKAVMLEIKQLNATKSMIAQYQSQKGGQVDDSESKTSLEARRAEATARLDVAKKEADALEKLLETARVKQQAEGGPNVNELWKEQKDLYTQIKNHRSEIRKVNGEFKDEVNKWRDYQRIFGNYKRALQRIQGDQRRAEWESRRAEADKAPEGKGEGLPSDDPVVGHPWQDEILMCSDLEKVLTGFLPSAKKEEEAKKEKEEIAAPPGCKVTKADEDDNVFGGLTKKKKGGKGKGQAPAEGKAEAGGKGRKIVLVLDTISSLSTLGVPIPINAEEVAATILALQAKKVEFEGKTAEDKKEYRASKGKNNAAKPTPAKKDKAEGGEAKPVDSTTEYPSLGGS
eukprot:CAMPEP_0180136200 /NCGR_PEP_ID=MMETSP0986-20121125/11342_1 /TAXON_ID=697907 /ORGANISM="non described non described, Strain CCMP2293" /LENGTH=532 /DNA_ID=CAMNT_0022077159 /DNA_START=31 /DNA_END=1629 /DNA_ORIENTATION=-